MNEKKDIIQVSFSGGRSSAMMAKICLDNYPQENLLFTFANTGKETNETLDFVNECDIRWNLNIVWIEYCIENKFKIVNYHTADRIGKPFEDLINKKKFLPNKFARFCTSDLKINPMAKYIKSLGFNNWDAAIGIRYDEPNRYHKMKNKVTKDPWECIFPLWDMKITNLDVQNFWKNQDFDLKIHSNLSNCDFCFMKGKAKKLSQARLMPDKLDWWIEMESKINSNFNKDYSMADLKKLANNPQLFDINDEPDISCFCGD